MATEREMGSNESMSKPRKPPADSRTVSGKLTVTEASRRLPDVINRVRYDGARFVLTKRGVPVAEICPVGDRRVVTAAGLRKRLASLPHLGIEDATRFADEIAEARASLAPLPRGPWD